MADEWRLGVLDLTFFSGERGNGRVVSAVRLRGSAGGSGRGDCGERTDHEGQGEKAEQENGELGHGFLLRK